MGKRRAGASYSPVAAERRTFNALLAAQAGKHDPLAVLVALRDDIAWHLANGVGHGTIAAMLKKAGLLSKRYSASSMRTMWWQVTSGKAEAILTEREARRVKRIAALGGGAEPQAPKASPEAPSPALSNARGIGREGDRIAPRGEWVDQREIAAHDPSQDAAEDGRGDAGGRDDDSERYVILRRDERKRRPGTEPFLSLEPLD